ncbi:MAG: hypothetical protein WD737_07185 [Gemmatimonadota bacterium]
MPGEDRDLWPLDPQRDPARWDRMVGSIMEAAGPELARRAVTRSPLLLLTEWLRPTVAASASVAALAAVIVLLFADVQSEATEGPGVVAEGIGLPTAVADWLDTGQPEALEELVFALDGENDD